MRRAQFLVWLLLFAPVSALASDFNPLGFYVGGAIGQARSAYTTFGASDETRTGWQAMVGLRPLAFFGAELEYVDFGTSPFGAPYNLGPLGGGFGGTEHATRRSAMRGTVE
jgi:hypothetical protein